MKMQIGQDKLEMLINNLDINGLNGRTTEQIGTITAIPKEVWNGLDGKPVAVITKPIIDEESGEFERIPNTKEGFENLQTGSRYIVIEIEKYYNGESISGKPIRIAIFSNRSVNIYKKILKGCELMDENNGEFTPISLEGHNIILYKLDYGQNPYYIRNKNTKSGWAEDSSGKPVPIFANNLLLFEDDEQLQTVVRREIRRHENEGAFAGHITEEPDQLPDTAKDNSQQQNNAKKTG